MTSGNIDFTLIKAGRLIDGLGGPPKENMAILVEGETIKLIGTQQEITSPAGAFIRELDYSGYTVLPGLVDAHTHLNGIGDGRATDDLATLTDDILLLQSVKNAQTTLRSGVTSIRENGSMGHTTLSLKEAIQMGIATGPNMMLCGRPLTITGGHMWYFGSEADGIDGVKREVRQLIKEGVDYIKIVATGGSTRTSFPSLPSYNVDELQSIADETHKFGKLTATHCGSTQGIINSLDAGIDMIIHCIFTEPDGTYKFNEKVAERIGKAGAYVNPTLHVNRSQLFRLQNKELSEGLSKEEHLHLERVKRGHETRLDHTRRMISMGLKVIGGSDSAWGVYPMGGFVHELDCLIEAGFSPSQAVVAGTRESAKSIGLGDLAGTIESGKPADILVVDGDPNEDINALWNVVKVLLGGKLVPTFVE